MSTTLPEGWVLLGAGWTVSTLSVEPNDDPNWLLALECARGSYQKNLVLGYESLSGSTLRGKAKQWAGRYSRSRSELLDRMRKKGVVFSEVMLGRARLLCIGDWPWDVNGNPKPTPPPPGPAPYHGPITSVADLFL